MSRKLHWYNTCPSGKKPYPSEEHALTGLLSTKIAGALRASAHGRRREARAYRCDQCSRWHLTSQMRRAAS